METFVYNWVVHRLAQVLCLIIFFKHDTIPVVIFFNMGRPNSSRPCLCRIAVGKNPNLN